jgi:hypothetical protein
MKEQASLPDRAAAGRNKQNWGKRLAEYTTKLHIS